MGQAVERAQSRARCNFTSEMTLVVNESRLGALEDAGEHLRDSPKTLLFSGDTRFLRLALRQVSDQCPPGVSTPQGWGGPLHHPKLPCG